MNKKRLIMSLMLTLAVFFVIQCDQDLDPMLQESDQVIQEVQNLGVQDFGIQEPESCEVPAESETQVDQQLEDSSLVEPVIQEPVDQEVALILQPDPIVQDLAWLMEQLPVEQTDVDAVQGEPVNPEIPVNDAKIQDEYYQLSRRLRRMEKDLSNRMHLVNPRYVYLIAQYLRKEKIRITQRMQELQSKTKTPLTSYLEDDPDEEEGLTWKQWLTIGSVSSLVLGGVLTASYDSNDGMFGIPAKAHFITNIGQAWGKVALFIR